MHVREAMTEGCESVRSSDSLQMAAQRMRDKDIGDVFVSDDSGKIVGILTDRDIATRAVAEGVNPDSEAGQCMSKDLISCYDDQDLEEAGRIMAEQQLRRLMVCNRSDEPVGVLAQADIARALRRDEVTGDIVDDVSRPGGQHSQSH